MKQKTHKSVFGSNLEGEGGELRFVWSPGKMVGYRGSTFFSIPAGQTQKLSVDIKQMVATQIVCSLPQQPQRGERVVVGLPRKRFSCAGKFECKSNKAEYTQHPQNEPLNGGLKKNHPRKSPSRMPVSTPKKGTYLYTYTRGVGTRPDIG